MLRHDAICLLQQLLIPCVDITEEVMSTCVGADRWLAIRQMSENISLEQPPLDDSNVPHDYFKEMQTFKKSLHEQRKEIKKQKRNQKPKRNLN